jgi:FtsP/CotA-like multicopper oxidase with cupredoxin domain
LPTVSPIVGIPKTAVFLPGANPVIQQKVVEHKVMPMHNITNEERFAAAKRAAEKGLVAGFTTGSTGLSGRPIDAAPPAPGATPDYFGPYPNYALSQLPIDDGLGNVTPGTGIRKFVDTLPGLGAANANNLGQYLTVAVPDTISYPQNGATPAADYYEIATVEWAEKVHSDIPPTTIRGYVQLETPIMNVANGSKHIPLTYLDGTPILSNITGLQVFGYEKPHFLGPTIIAQKDKPVRIKFFNYLKTGGNLSIPDDVALMGNGLGPLGANGSLYSQQRATVHLHGGNTPWISDGTQHQWTVPAGEVNSYPKGASVSYVPDMDGGIEPPGVLTFYYTNQQGARLMFYHEHAMGITRLGVYAGQAAGYIVQDPAEAGLVANGTIPSTQIPLIIIDRSFVPNATQMTSQDPTWNAGGNKTTAWPHTGDFYFPHVYMPAQNPADLLFTNAMGRWDYGPWAWPPKMIPLNGPVANPYYAGAATPWEPAQMPGVPSVSQVPETFMDTPLINGVAYPKLTVGPHAYRFRILNAANERFFNLQLYYAANNGTMWFPNNGTLANGTSGEVPMTAAVADPNLPGYWPKDGRAGGVPWFNKSGPSWVQIGTEGGFLPAPVVIPPQPIDWDYQHRSVALLNVLNHSLLIGPAERADVIVDFTGIPNGTKLILYNDAPAPFPGADSRYDFYTGDPDQRLIGGAPTTNAGYGPNTRTLMQIEIVSSIPGQNFNLATLNTQLPQAYRQIQDTPIVTEAAYNGVYGTAYTNQYVGTLNTSMTFTPPGQTPVTLNLQPKAITEGFDPEFGRITANFGVEVPAVPHQSLESAIGYMNNDPVTEVFNNSVAGTLIGTQADGTQIWKVTHNGVDTHILHTHMFNMQLINRVWWDGTIVPPAPNELGWKESVEIHPLQDLVVAIRPIAPNIPWEVPNSIRNLNAVTPTGSANPMEFTNLDPQGNAVTVVNHAVNYGYEYLWHCHLLGHEENDMMRTFSVAIAPKVPPSGLTATQAGTFGSPKVNLAWTDNSVSETDWSIQRSTAPGGPWVDIAQVSSTTGPQKGGVVNYTDTTPVSNTTYYYQVMASNVVGDRTVYPGAVGYPVVTANSTFSNVAVVGQGQVIVADKIGVYRNGTWYRDVNGNWTYDAIDATNVTTFGWPTDLSVTGDWTGSGKTKIGVYRGGTWYRDINGNGIWDAVDAGNVTSFGWPNDLPVTGDWVGSGTTYIGVFRDGVWYRDINGNGVWDAIDAGNVTAFGWPTDTPVTGDWVGAGKTYIGVYRNGVWYRDMNGNGIWDPYDTTYVREFGWPTDKAVTGDWSGTGTTKMGVLRNGIWYVDWNGNGVWDSVDVLHITDYGLPGDIGVVGKW